jgi:hypothetical protein
LGDIIEGGESEELSSDAARLEIFDAGEAAGNVSTCRNSEEYGVKWRFEKR